MAGLSRNLGLSAGCLWLASLGCARAADEPVPAAPTVFDLLLPLLLVLVTGALAWWLVKRRGSLTKGDGPVQLLQIVAVGPRERLLLVRVGERQLLCGATPAQITLLAQLDPPADQGSSKTTPPAAREVTPTADRSLSGR